MTPAELAVLRDRVARKRLELAEIGVMPRPRNGWSEERTAAGDAALDALREAKRRTGKKAFKEAMVPRPPRGAYRTRQRWCVYCGIPTRATGYPATCICHNDLPVNDPMYQGELLLRNEA